MKKILPIVIELKGSCKGISTTQVERTDRKALYSRSDGYWECFYVKEAKEKVFKEGKWIPTGDAVERYPKDEDFGRWAWCGREKSIRSIYQGMNGNQKANSDVTVSEISDDLYKDKQRYQPVKTTAYFLHCKSDNSILPF